jgi:hypothetical protein
MPAFFIGARFLQRHIRIGPQPTFGARWLIPRLQRFLAAHPDVQVRGAARPAPSMPSGLPRRPKGKRGDSRGEIGWVHPNSDLRDRMFDFPGKQAFLVSSADVVKLVDTLS